MAGKKEETAEPAEAAPAEGGKASKLPLILGLVNTLLILGVVGVAVYTRIVFKRPAITEEAERDRVAKMKASPPPASASGSIMFEPVTVNIEPSPAKPAAADGTGPQIQGKLHYVYIGFSIDVRDMGRKDEVEALRPILLDGVLSMLGKKAFAELTTVQGRYVLRTQILELANHLINKKEGGGTVSGQEPLFTNVFFTHFIVQ